jgi:hypothetical protein
VLDAMDTSRQPESGAIMVALRNDDGQCICAADGMLDKGKFAVGNFSEFCLGCTE